MNIDQRTRPTLKERLEFALQAPCDCILKASCVRYATFLAMFRLLPPSYLAWASRVKARRAYYRALREVPAYRQFLRAEGGPLVPETDKENYIKPYETAARWILMGLLGRANWWFPGAFLPRGSRARRGAGQNAVAYP